MNIAKNQSPEIFIKCSNPALNTAFSKELEVFRSLIRSGEVKMLANGDADPAGSLSNFVNDDVTIFTKVIGIVDIKLEIERVNKRNTQLSGLIEKLQQKINMKGYDKKVPEAVRNENLEKLKSYETEIEQNKKGVEDLAKFI